MVGFTTEMVTLGSCKQPLLYLMVIFFFHRSSCFYVYAPHGSYQGQWEEAGGTDEEDSGEVWFSPIRIILMRSPGWMSVETVMR